MRGERASGTASSSTSACPTWTVSSVIRGLRGWTPVPIVVLSGRAGSHDKMDALDAGADDYVTKPFSMEELLARVRAVTRRQASPGSPASARIGRYTVDLVQASGHFR